MNFFRFKIQWICSILVAGILTSSQARTSSAQNEITINVEPQELTLEIGETFQLEVVVTDSSGTVDNDVTVVFFSRARRSVSVTRTGMVEAYRPGEFTLVVLVPADPEDTSRNPNAIGRVEIPVTVPSPPIESIRFTSVPSKFYVGTNPGLQVSLVDETGIERRDVEVFFSSSDNDIASIDGYGTMTLLHPGTVMLSASTVSLANTITVTVEENPIDALTLEAAEYEVRTGDVVEFTAFARDRRGRRLDDIPVRFAVSGKTHSKIIAAGAAAMITSEGRFVAERSGIFTVIATAGDHVAIQKLRVRSRDVRQNVEVIGRGKVREAHSSDLWVWEGADGRDYAITGTWGSNGDLYIWDVSDPSNIEQIQVIHVDARTVNDVKVSEDGDVAVISREGASDRKNGIVVLGVGNPYEGVPILSEFTDQLTGGVHNVFISDDHVYALSASRRYDVISIEDPRKPIRVGRFELDTPGHSIHDVWISDGIAFSSNWADGVVAVDVGGGGKGGTPERPIELGRYSYPSGWNHAAFPYRSPSTGKFYLFAGDEAFPYGSLNNRKGTIPTIAAGWIHVIEWSDWDNPREVARYQVPEAGSHNLWIEDDILYVGYYNGGLRVVDVSGELLGDLYKQGREIARFIPYDPDGYIANAPFVWGAQPFKGHIFFTDWNSGLWAVRILPKEELGQMIGEPQ